MLSFAPFLAWVVRGRGAADDDSAALLPRLTAGDREAWALLYQREAPAVYRYALALGGNEAWAADATQEAFVALAARPQGYDPGRGALGAYLAGVARHALSARWRETRAEAPWPEDGDDTLDAADSVVCPEALLVRRQDQAAVWSALRALPAPFREALVLVDLQERPYAEAAQIAGIELNTLRTRVHRGRLKLAALLGADPRCLP
jgi:RNA polymerase sigma-70 factor (ECF subfamily)